MEKTRSDHPQKEMMDEFDRYLRQVEELPALNDDESAQLIERARRGDTVARQRLVEGHLARCAVIALEHRPDWLDTRGAVQEANLVLLELLTRGSRRITSELTPSIIRHFKALQPPAST